MLYGYSVLEKPYMILAKIKGNVKNFYSTFSGMFSSPDIEMSAFSGTIAT